MRRSVRTVRLDDVILQPSGLYLDEPRTMAHVEMCRVARLYQEAFRGRRRSWVERIAAAPSPFAVEGLLSDFRLFGSRDCSVKTRAQVHETARVRLCELRGVLP